MEFYSGANSEGIVRQKLIEENLLDAVIGLPQNLFYGTGIPGAILLFRRNKPDDTVMFIDASHDFEPEANQNKLGMTHIKRVVNTYRARTSIERYSYVATCEEISRNDFNLNISRYVDTFAEEEDINLCAVQAEIIKIEEELLQVKKLIEVYLEELGLSSLQVEETDKGQIRPSIEIHEQEEYPDEKELA